MRTSVETDRAQAAGRAGGSVAVHIYGGLGNQMFQYACGRALALRRGARFCIDRRDFAAGPDQVFGLHHFNIVAQSGGDQMLPPTKKQRLRYLVWRYGGRTPRFTREKSAAFDPEVLRLTGDTWLHGYWQSESYFDDCRDAIREELTIITPPSERNERLLEELRALPAVSLHVRRGDYVSNPKALAHHGTCTPAYYRSAAQLVAGKTGIEPVFFVFSDEPDWARQHLDLPFETRIVDHNDNRHNYEDMRLMAACRHHVIANSSFSWWGAWLNPSTDKIVVAPEKWVTDPAMQNPRITPEGWIRLSP